MSLKTCQSLRIADETAESFPWNTPLASADDELVRLRALKHSISDLSLSFDRVLAERDDLRRLVLDLRKELAAALAARDSLATERDALRAALERAAR